MNKQKLLNHLQSTDTKYGKALKLFEYLAETYNQEVDFWERVDEEILLLGKNHYWHPVLTPIKTSNLRLEDDIVEYWGLRKINHDLYDKKDYKIKSSEKYYWAFTKLDTYDLSVAEISAMIELDNKCMFFSGMDKVKDGAYYAKVDQIEAYLLKKIKEEIL